MRFSAQQVDPHAEDHRLVQQTWYVFCAQESENNEWVCQRLDDLQLSKRLSELGLDDHRDQFEVLQQVRAAIREFGPGNGYIDYDLETDRDRGPVRHQGELGLSPSTKDA